MVILNHETNTIHPNHLLYPSHPHHPNLLILPPIHKDVWVVWIGGMGMDGVEWGDMGVWWGWIGMDTMDGVTFGELGFSHCLAQPHRICYDLFWQIYEGLTKKIFPKKIND